MLSAIFHLSVTSWYMYAVYYDQQYLDFPFPVEEFEEFPLKSRHAFMTMWCLTLQTLYFLVALLNDLFGTNALASKNPPFIRKVKDHLFSLAFPLAVFVTLTFWSIYAFDKELILPEVVRKAFPWWMNHTVHTLILVFITIELLTSARNYPARNTGVALMVALSVAYAICTFVIYLKTKMFIYPFLNEVPLAVSLTLFALSPVTSVAFYVTCEKIHYVVWPKQQIYVNGKSH